MGAYPNGIALRAARGHGPTWIFHAVRCGLVLNDLIYWKELNAEHESPAPFDPIFHGSHFS